ncbi:hypothetical protein FLONG3_2550 [Fusarium longipes]|uniref:Uncharacterized protein n=1 Tax=Fusarium longipes TaxID=694270 RepID=A0A395T3T0_9HYPO|nr:hypothetical protein FLONG3_2550 [Fusarium longipes]
MPPQAAPGFASKLARIGALVATYLRILPTKVSNSTTLLPFAQMDDKAIDLQLSRIISAVEYTTIFTTIVPKPTAKADVTSTTEAPVVTVTQEASQDVNMGGFPGGKIFGALEIIIALGVLVGVLLLIMGIILCDRRRKSKKRKQASERVHKRMTEKSEPPSENSQASQPPMDARLPGNIWPRMAEQNQTVHDYWHQDATRQKQAWEQVPPGGMPPAIDCSQKSKVLLQEPTPVFAILYDVRSCRPSSHRVPPPEEIYRMAWEYGQRAVPYLYGLYVQREVGQAVTQQKASFKEMQEGIHRFLELVERKEVRLVPGAFNSTPSYINYFQSAALCTLTFAVMDVAQGIRRVGAALESIQSEIAIGNLMNIQGWGVGGFGGYIYRFVQNEMAAFDGTRGDEDEVHHYFYVWHPNNDWYTAFEERQAENALGPNFGGYHHDLPTLYLRMRADRQALIETTEFGRTAVFHLVIPAYQPLVVDSAFKFAEELFPLMVTGTRHRGTDMVWLALDQHIHEERPTLQFVSILPDAREEFGRHCMDTTLYSVAGGIACVVTGTVFLPCAPAADIALNCFLSTYGLSIATFFAAGILSNAIGEDIQVLGRAMFLV